MNNHPDKNKIIRAASGLDDISAISAHLEMCSDCKKYFKEVSRIISASDNSQISVPEEAEHRIINSYRNIKLNIPDRSSRKFSGFARPLFAAFMLLAAVTLSALFYSSYYMDEERKIYFKGIYGDTFVNGVHFDEILISSGDRIVTKSAGSSELEIEKMFFINVYPDSEIIVEKSFYSKKEKLNVFNFKIMTGTLFAKFEKTADLKYKFTTPDALIESMGTEFVIELAGDSTTVIVTEGKLSVTSLKSGEKITALPDKIYKVKNNIEMFDADKNLFADDDSVSQDFSDAKKIQQGKIEKTSESQIKKSDDVKVNKNSGLKDADHEIKSETRKIMRETRKEINRDMRGEMRKEMKKERGGAGRQ